MKNSTQFEAFFARMKKEEEERLERDTFIAAARNGDLQTVSALIERRSELIVVGTLPGAGPSAMDLAVERGDLKMVDLLLTKGADADERDGAPLREAAASGHFEIVKLLLAKGAKANIYRSGLSSPLHIAASKGDLKTIQLLLAHKAEINSRPTDNGTPFDCAVRGGHIETAKFLLAQGGQAYVTNDIFEPEYKPIKRPRKINESPNNIAAIIKAACTGDARLVRNLLNEHPNLLFVESDHHCYTPLRTAAHYGHTKIVKLLLAKGAAINGKAPSSSWFPWRRRPRSLPTTPLYEAAHQGHSEIVELLCARGADVNAGNHNETPLHAAAKGGHKNVVDFLLSRGADVSARNYLDETPLHAAAEFGHADTVRLLLSKGVAVNAKATSGKTALHLASSGKGHQGVAALLLSAGAEVNSRMDDGRTPLALAAAGHDVMMGLENDPIYFVHHTNQKLIELLSSHGGRI